LLPDATGGRANPVPGGTDAGPAGSGSSGIDPYATNLPTENWAPAATSEPPAAERSLASDGPPPTYDPGSFRSVRHRDQRASAAPANQANTTTQTASAPGRLAQTERSVLVEPPAAGPLQATQARPLTATDAEPLLLNTRSFALDYELHDIQPAAIAEVQLWATDDGGAHWAQWGADQDHVSPVDVQVRAEGVFGFRVVVSHRNGFSSRPPVDGDPADIWVRVDTTPPQVELTSAVYGSGLKAGQLDIQWTASDADLSPRPVSLFYRDTASGPWTAIERGLANTGAYAWRVPPTIAAEFFVRIEVKDRAGNRAEHQLDSPIRIDGLLPRARIRAVRD
jgi:hypothetical protein